MKEKVERDSQNTLWSRLARRGKGHQEGYSSKFPKVEIDAHQVITIGNNQERTRREIIGVGVPR